MIEFETSATEGYVLVVFQNISYMVSDNSAVCKSDTNVYSTFLVKDFPGNFFAKPVCVSSTSCPYHH